MSFFEIILLGIGLSMDAAAVSISNALCMKTIQLKKLLMVCISFAVFQGIMPLIGYFAASMFSVYISTFDHWIALILLLFIGGKMLYEALTEQEDTSSCFNLTLKMLLLQSIATSIDALAVGVSFSALDVNIIYAVSVIAVTTFLCCAIAMIVAQRFGRMLGKRAEIVGGIILIGIGAKIFIEHMFFS